MADIKLIEAQIEEIFAILADDQAQIDILNVHYHKNSLVKDELLRLKDELLNGAKSTAVVSKEAVIAEIQASKVVTEPKESVIIK